jgi:hypothetical protein
MNKITKYKDYIIMSCGPNAYRLFKNDLLIDQYWGTAKEAKIKIDNLIKL